MVRFGLWYDFRNPAEWRRPLADVYAETLAQAGWAEQLGYDDIWTTEHHFVDDDYSPSLLPICASIAAQTTRVRIGTAVLLLPLHDPVRVAEDAATVDVISGGRFDLGVGIGYRKKEFASFGIPPNERGKRMSEALEVLRSAWEPGPFTFHGEHYVYGGVDVRPKPVQSPAPLWVAGLTPPAVARAARLGTGFIAGAGENLIPAYRAACLELGKPVGEVATGLGFHAIDEDTDRGWSLIAPHLFYQRQMYAQWLREAGTPVWQVPDSPGAIRAAEPDLVVTPQRALEIVRARLAADPEITNLYWSPLLPGLRPDQVAASVELFASHVIEPMRIAAA